MARRGVSSCALGLVLLALVPRFATSRVPLAILLLRAAAVCLAFTSATVVNALTAYASLQCDEAVDSDTGKPHTTHPELAKGRALGQFRSSGQLGRAIGPLLGTCLFPFAYFVSLVIMLTCGRALGSMCVVLDCRSVANLCCRRRCDVPPFFEDETHCSQTPFGLNVRGHTGFLMLSSRRLLDCSLLFTLALHNLFTLFSVIHSVPCCAFQFALYLPDLCIEQERIQINARKKSCNRIAQR